MALIIFSLLALITYSCNGVVTDTELSQIMQTIWNVDVNRLDIGTDISINLQTHTDLYDTRDRASGRLFTSVPDLSRKSTYKKFIALLNNYEHPIDQTDRASNAEETEQMTLLNSIQGTQVWQRTRSFLKTEGYISSSGIELTRLLQGIWFEEYSRSSGVTGSSGFEHVFVGETKDTDELSGLHNWVALYQLEQSGEANYKGYLRTDVQNSIYELKIQFGSATKLGNTMFVGTSPEYEMAMYTICFLARPNAECTFDLNGNSVTIQTYKSYNGVMGTAYPKIYA